MPDTLTGRLAALGIVHEPSLVHGKRDWYDRSGVFLGAFDAREGWEECRILELIIFEEKYK